MAASPIHRARTGYDGAATTIIAHSAGASSRRVTVTALAGVARADGPNEEATALLIG